MYIIDSSNLHDGMTIGLDVIVNNQVVLPKGTILTNKDIQQLSSLLDSDIKVWIYDLMELKPILLKDNIFARKCVDFLVNQFRQLFLTAISSKLSFDNLMNMLSNQLFNNRQLLYKLIVLRDSHCYTYEHSLNVALYALIIGLNEGLTSKELQTLVLGCALHDLGKLNISNSILDKPSKLTDTEFKAIQQHPLYGIELARSLNYADDRVEKIILQHHEKLDSTGYPYGVGYEKISHLARLAAVADIFDAVTSTRVYHKKRSLVEGIKILDNDVIRGKIAKDEVDNLVQSIVLYPINTVVVLNNNVSGVIVENCNSRTPTVLGFNNVIYDLSKDSSLHIDKVL